MSMKFDTTGIESYITDPESEAVKGSWLNFPGGRRFRVKRAGGANKKFTRAFNAATRPYKRQMDAGTMDDDLGDEIMRDLYARTIIMDWEGIKDAEGNDVPFTQDNVKAFFAQFPELFNEVVKLSNDLNTFAEYKVREAEEALGN